MICPRSKGPLVYVAYSANREAIYVGQTENWPDRLRKHSSQSPWFGDVAYFETEACADRRQALWLEGVLIRQLDPRENVMGKVGVGQQMWRQQFRQAS